MKTLKIILGIFIVLLVIGIIYTYINITSVSFDWLGEGKLFSIFCLITLSLILFRFSLKDYDKMNSINLTLSVITIFTTIYCIQNSMFFFSIWNYLLLFFLIQSTFVLWSILKLNQLNLFQKTLFLTGPILIGLCIVTGWIQSFGSLIRVSLFTTTIVSIITLFRKQTT